MKKVVLLFMAVTVSAIIYAQTDAIKQYIQSYQEIAINEMIRTGVPAAITLAQGILESKAGQSDLCQQSNNHFGIKCKDEWTGPYVLHDDDQKNECFRVYPNAAESFKDHSDFLKNRPYYTDLFSLAPDDYAAWARGLKKDGYATERNYPELLVKLIEDNNLQQYTSIAMQRMRDPNQPVYVSNTTTAAQPATDNSSAVVKNDNDKGTNTAISDVKQDDDDNNTPANSNTSADLQTTNAATDNYPEGVFSINDTRVVYAKAGTSLFALASSYNIAYKTLLNFNEIEKGDILPKGRLIYLERKPKNGGRDFHVVTAAETIEEIAQKEGVRLESLLQYNSVQKGSQLAAGTKVYLRIAPGATARSRRV